MEEVVSDTWLAKMGDHCVFVGGGKSSLLANFKNDFTLNMKVAVS